MLVSSVAEIALSLQPSPASDTSAFRRMRALVSNCAGLLPARTSDSSCSPLPGAQLHHVFLDRNLFPGHESSPPLPNRDRDSEKTHHIQGRERLGVGGDLRQHKALLASEPCEGVVAIHGKVLRRSFDSASGKSPLHMVSAWGL